MAAEVRYPACEVELVGTSKNAVLIIMRVHKALWRYLVQVEGLSSAQAEPIADEFREEAKSGDYDDVLITCFRWVTVK